MQKGATQTDEEKLKILKGVIDTYAQGEFTIKSILDTVPIAESTFHAWLRNQDEKFKELKDAYKKAQLGITQDTIRQMIPRVVNNLQKLADGFEYEEEETVFYTDKKGKPQVRSKKVVKKKVPPNLGANVFIAKNAAPDLFKDAMEHNVSGKIAIPQGIDFDKLTEEQRKVIESLL
jgi:hypothetical protein